MKTGATQGEMEERAGYLIDYAARHYPVTVRQLYYRAEVCPVGTPPSPPDKPAAHRCVLSPAYLLRTRFESVAERRLCRYHLF